MPPSSQSMRFCVLPPAQHSALNRFYRVNGYKGKISAQEQALCLQQGQHLIAALRLHWHDYGWLMRGVWVERKRRGEGLGSLLLAHSTEWINGKPCYCFPFSHLDKFYAAAGFIHTDEEAPAALQQALRRYRQRGEDVLLMKYHNP